MTDDKDALLPCPICPPETVREGLKQFAYSTGTEDEDHIVQCLDCSCIGGGGKTAAEAVAKWNRRASLSAEPVAVVGVKQDTWKGYGGKWSPPGGPINTVMIVQDLPEGTQLYSAPPALGDGMLRAAEICRGMLNDPYWRSRNSFDALTSAIRAICAAAKGEPT